MNLKKKRLSMQLSHDGTILCKVDNNDIKPDGSCDIPKSVTAIRYGAFMDCEKLQSLVISDSVTSIGAWAFENCKNLHSITISRELTSIGDRAFKGCEKLQSLIIPDGVTSIGQRAFWECKNLHSMTLPNYLISIGYGAFWGCEKLQSLIIPDSVISIGFYAFMDCKNLHSITLPNKGMTSIGYGVFGGCEKLQSLIIPDSVTSIKAWAFGGCKNLLLITLPEGLTSISKKAFNWDLAPYSCYQIINTLITRKAFDRCESLHSIVIAGKDAQKIAHVTTLLPMESQNKITTQALAQRAFGLMNEQLGKVAKSAETNCLYPFLNLHSRFSPQIKVKDEEGNCTQIPCQKLPEEVFELMNEYSLQSNPYYKNAQMRMRKIPLPKNHEEKGIYKQKIEHIANNAIKRAKNFQFFFLKEQEVPEPSSRTHPNSRFCAIS